MPAFGKSPRGNMLLAALPADERSALAGELERVPLRFKEVLQEIDRPLEHAWFPHRGVASAVSRMANGEVVEVGTVGREGMVGLPLVLEAEQSAHQVFAQIPGEADRIAAASFRRLMAELPGLRRLAMRYTLTFITQISQGSACNRLHPIEARCARWLLLTHDRVDGDVFELTQEFLAQMLGVTRPSVSIAAGMLQKAGLISYVRGTITILDRPGLEAASCECYGIMLAEFESMIRP